MSTPRNQISPRRSIRLRKTTHTPMDGTTDKSSFSNQGMSHLTSTPFSHASNLFNLNDSGISIDSFELSTSKDEWDSPSGEQEIEGESKRLKAEYFDFYCESFESRISKVDLQQMHLQAEFDSFPAMDECISSNYSSQEDLSDYSQTSDYFSCDSSNDFPSLSSSFDLDSDYELNSDAEKEFEKVLKQHSPTHPEQLIGRKMGCGDLDIISSLGNKGIVCPLDNIFGYFDGYTISRMLLVSKSWQKIICDNKRALCKLKQHRESNKSQGSMKENNRQKKKGCHQACTRASGPMKPAQHVADSTRMSPPALSPLKRPSYSLSATGATRYWEVGVQLRNDESLRKCPRCSSPARADSTQERATCCLHSCGFDFCIKCKQEFHFSRACHSKTRPSKSSTAVSSRKSKRNLRRL